MKFVLDFTQTHRPQHLQIEPAINKHGSSHWFHYIHKNFWSSHDSTMHNHIFFFLNHSYKFTNLTKSNTKIPQASRIALVYSLIWLTPKNVYCIKKLS